MPCCVLVQVWGSPRWSGAVFMLNTAIVRLTYCVPRNLFVSFWIHFSDGCRILPR